MKILNSRTEPFDAPLSRRHRPTKATGKNGYRKYRGCLRWEFGFTCPFCLLHEADLVRGGAERSGVVTIEHRLPQKSRPASANVYSNCLLCCKYCNRARSIAPIAAAGECLLDPTKVAWSVHFDVRSDRLLEKAGDVDAKYTQQSYKLNDPIKMEKRLQRRQLLSDFLPFVKKGPAELAMLVKIAGEIAQFDAARAAKLVETTRRMRKTLRAAVREVRRFSIVPVDAPKKCRCAHLNAAAARTVCATLERQSQMVAI